MNAVELFDEAQNGVVLKTSQKLCFENIIFLAVNVAASMGDICGQKKISWSCCLHVEQKMASKEGGETA